MQYAMENTLMNRKLSGRRGMTLFEIMIVIVVLGIISGMMFRIMVVNARENRNLLSRVERARALHLALEGLLRDIESAVPYPQQGRVLFELVDGAEGATDSDRITFVVPIRQQDGSVGIVERSYFLQRDLFEEKVVWNLAWSYDTTVDGKVESNRGHVITQLGGMQTVSFDVKASPSGQNVWKSAWETETVLPEKVEVRLRATDPSDPEHPVEVAGRVYLMAG